MLLRWEESEAEEEDDEAEATALEGSGSTQLTEPEGGEVSGPTAPCSASPAAAACSASRVGEEGGEGRDFFLLEDRSLRRLFFSLCSNKTAELYVRELRQLLKATTVRHFNNLAKAGKICEKNTDTFPTVIKHANMIIQL